MLDFRWFAKSAGKQMEKFGVHVEVEFHGQLELECRLKAARSTQSLEGNVAEEQPFWQTQ